MRRPQEEPAAAKSGHVLADSPLEGVHITYIIGLADREDTQRPAATDAAAARSRPIRSVVTGRHLSIRLLPEDLVDGNLEARQQRADQRSPHRVHLDGGKLSPP